MHSIFLPIASESSNGTFHSEAKPQQVNRVQSRKHAISDKIYEEMGLILEPWKVRFSRDDMLIYGLYLIVEKIFKYMVILALYCNDL